MFFAKHSGFRAFREAGARRKVTAPQSGYAIAPLFTRLFADRGSMNAVTPEPRIPVMIVVEATWEDQSGALQTARARMENRSVSGACIRLSSQVKVGTKLKIQWRWDKFIGITKYCRSEGRDFLVGLQRATEQKV